MGFNFDVYSILFGRLFESKFINRWLYCGFRFNIWCCISTYLWEDIR